MPVARGGATYEPYIYIHTGGLRSTVPLVWGLLRLIPMMKNIFQNVQRCRDGIAKKDVVMGYLCSLCMPCFVCTLSSLDLLSVVFGNVIPTSLYTFRNVFILVCALFSCTITEAVVMLQVQRCQGLSYTFTRVWATVLRLHLPYSEVINPRRACARGLL